MAAGSVLLVAVLRDARKRAPQDEVLVRRYDSNLGNAVLKARFNAAYANGPFPPAKSAMFHVKHARWQG
jgi:hypothetical protein